MSLVRKITFKKIELGYVFAYFFSDFFCDLYVIFKTNCLSNFQVGILSNKEAYYEGVL